MIPKIPHHEYTSLNISLCDQCHRVLVTSNGRTLQMRHSVGKDHKCFSTTISKVFSMNVNKTDGKITETSISKSTQWEQLLSGDKTNCHSYSKDRADRTKNRRKNAVIRRRTKNSPIPQGIKHTYMVGAGTIIPNYDK